MRFTRLLDIHAARPARLVDSACSDPGGLFIVMALILAALTGVLYLVSWVLASLLSGPISVFVRWLPVVALWTPVFGGFDGPPFPAGIALLGILDGERDLLVGFLISEVIALSLLALYAAKHPGSGGKRPFAGPDN